MEIIAAAVTAVLTFVFGQIVQRFVLQPISAFHRQRADLSFIVLLNQQTITNVSAGADVKKDLREIGAAIISEAGRIPAYDTLSRWGIFRLPPYYKVVTAIQELNGIVHELEKKGNGGIEIAKSLDLIASLLEIQTTYKIPKKA